MSTTFADALCIALKQRAVDYIFGMPGGASLPMLEAMRRHGITFVLCRHEGSAGFMADGVAQRTGGLGVCIATLGPGVTNLVSGVAGAYLERSRVLAITAQIEPHIQGIYTHQILNQQALFQSICKEYITIHPKSVHPQLLQLFRKLEHGEAAPVVLEIPSSSAKAPCLSIRKEISPTIVPQPVMQLVSYVQKAKHPIIFVGCAQMDEEFCAVLTKFAEHFQIPVLTTYRAKGVLSEYHPLSMGACGLSPKVDSILLAWMQKSDLVLTLGLDAVELRPNWLEAWIVPTISISPSSCANDLTIPLLLDIRSSATSHLQFCLEHHSNPKESWCDTSQYVKENLAALFVDEPHGPASMVAAIQRGAPQNTVLSLDVGAHRITASHVWKCTRPRNVLQSNGFSSMGVGVPMAIAVKLQEPDTCSIALCGDMGFAMSLGELGVVQDHDLHLIVIYFRDNSLKLIALKQQRAGFPESGMNFCNPEPTALANAFGGQARITHTCLELEQAVQEASQSHGLWLIEATIDPQSYNQQL